MTTHPVHRRKKLIEVAIPLEAINAASAREKSIRHGHPSTLHLWWARRPLAAARAVIFCQMVDDPSAVPEEFPTEDAQENERLRLFALISELVQWENTTNEEVLERARAEMRRSWIRCCADNADHPEAAELFNPEKLPGFHDPFAGGGALPLEAQRLGLEAYASDLNPVAVLINKAMIEIPPKFAGMPPVNPEARSKKQLIAKEWKGAEGLAADVRYYGQWMRDEAEKRIGHLYPKVKITPEMVNDPENPRPDLKPYEGQELTVIAWLWARTVKSPNPAFSHLDVPLASSFLLCAKEGKESFVEPEISKDGFKFRVKMQRPVDVERVKLGTSAGKRAAFKCILSGEPIAYSYIRSEGKAGRHGLKLMAIAAEGMRGRIYLSPLPEHEALALECKSQWEPAVELPKNPRDFKTPNYGLSKFSDLFTKRHLLTLSVYSGLISELKSQITEDISSGGISVGSPAGLSSCQPRGEYIVAIQVFLSLAVNNLLDDLTTLATWRPTHGTGALGHAFSRQAIPMTWDFPEASAFGGAAGDLRNSADAVARSLEMFPAKTEGGYSFQEDAAQQRITQGKIVSTDPPYYDNISYGELSDYFYVWLRRSLSGLLPGLFETISTPKIPELIASAYRHGGKEAAEQFFLEGMSKAIASLREQAHPACLCTIFYAFKQTESKGEASATSTGWETFLRAVIDAGFAVIGTWPVRTERSARSLGQGKNALASSVVLVCIQREDGVPVVSRKEFRRRLKSEIPLAIAELEGASVAPVDIAQAAIGPGMAVFSGAKNVLNPDDTPMSVREALAEINSALDEYLSQAEGELDADTRFALTFFEAFGYQERDYGDAEGLAVARNISVDGVVRAGILRAAAGKAQLLRREQFDDSWDPD